MDTKTILPIKIGSDCNVKNGNANEEVIEKIAKDISSVRFSQNKFPVIIFSGAVALGKQDGFGKKSLDQLRRKVSASIGQGKLTEAYSSIFKKYCLVTGQFLFTYRDLKNKEIARKLRETLHACFDEGIIPLINFNDPLDSEEVSADNDKFAAKIAILLDATVLLILTDKVDGLIDSDGFLIREIEIKEIKEINRYKKFCFKKTSQNSIGGMETKLEAAKIVLEQGGLSSRCIIGNIKYPLEDLLLGNCPYTVFKKIED